MIDTGYLYIVPLGIGMLLLLMQLLLNQNLGRKKPLESDYGNLFHNLSEVAPFKWFVEQDPRHIKALKMNHLIKEASMEKKLDYRSATAMQFVLLFGGVAVFLLVNMSLMPIIGALAFLFNLDPRAILEDPSSLSMIRVVLAFVTFSPGLMIKPYLKRKAKTNEIEFIKDLPLLQLFIILMLKSDRTIGEVMYVLSTTKSTYQRTFQQAYLIYLRDPEEGFTHLEEVFDGTRLIETIYTLRDYAEYDKHESIKTLENNQEDIEEFTKQARKKAEAGKNLFATISMTFPFLAVLALGAAPLAYWALNLITTSL